MCEAPHRLQLKLHLSLFSSNDYFKLILWIMKLPVKRWTTVKGSNHFAEIIAVKPHCYIATSLSKYATLFMSPSIPVHICVKHCSDKPEINIEC